MILNILFFLATPFVIGKLRDQLGNNMFQIATTCAHAWDNKAIPYFPDLSRKLDDGMPTNYEHVFFRLNAEEPEGDVTFEWKCPLTSNFTYHPIPYQDNMCIRSGTFQSETYFAKYRPLILELFAPHPDDLELIKSKYSHILNHPNTVGVQVRWFGCEHDLLWNQYLVQYGYDYFDKAMSKFPEDTLFIITSSDAAFAKANIPDWPKNMIVLDEPYYIEFFILSRCKHQIISNSTFGWWAAWLNQNPDKIIIRPELWVDPEHAIDYPVNDVYPPSWIIVESKWGKPIDPITSFKEDINN